MLKTSRNMRILRHAFSIYVLPSLLALALCVLPATASEPQYFPGSTVKHFQLTGDRDAPRRTPTPTLTETRAGVVATDLGSSFEHEGRLYFLFGDTWGRPGARDVLAWTENTAPNDLTLDFHDGSDGKFLPLAVPGVSLGAFEVPSYGISVADRMYVVFTTDHDVAPWTMGRSVLAASDDDGRTFSYLYGLSTEHFINVTLATALQEDCPGLPADRCVLIWGSGMYRASSPRLACIPVSAIGWAGALRYYAGTLGQTGACLWSPQESEAVELFHHRVIGELSVAWIAQLERWVMLYNSSEPRGIVMRTSELPWGPWSDPVVIFDPWRDMGYARFMHVSWDHEQMDTFHDFDREYEWGGEYGSYIIPRFTQGTAERCTIFYTMSTWNPYQVVLMSSDVGDPNVVGALHEVRVQTLPRDNGWRVTGHVSGRFLRNDVPHVTTWGPHGDAEMAVAHYGFPFDANDGALSFSIHGGGGEVVLVAEETPPPTVIADIPSFYGRLKAGDFGPVVEAIAGPTSNDVDISVRWNLRRHAGKKLRLFIVDHLAEPWGFISVSQFTIVEMRSNPSGLPGR